MEQLVVLMSIILQEVAYFGRGRDGWYMSIGKVSTSQFLEVTGFACPKTNEGHVCLDTSYWLQARYCYKGSNKVVERVANWQIHEDDKPTSQKVLPNRWQHGKGESRLHEKYG